MVSWYNRVYCVYIGYILGLYSGYIGVILDTYWGLYWGYIGVYIGVINWYHGTVLILLYGWVLKSFVRPGSAAFTWAIV